MQRRVFDCKPAVIYGSRAVVERRRISCGRLEAIRGEVQGKGRATIDRQTLAMFCPETMTVSEQIHCVAEIARAGMVELSVPWRGVGPIGGYA